MADPIVIARSDNRDIALLPALANRHGAVTGATGTGKTITMQVLAEGFSKIGVPVFMADSSRPSSRNASIGWACPSRRGPVRR
jgi:hypothetical protein